MKNFKTKFAGLSVLSAAGISSSFAAVPTEVTTALTDAGTDAAAIAGVVLVVIVGIVAFNYMRRAVH